MFTGVENKFQDISLQETTNFSSSTIPSSQGLIHDFPDEVTINIFKYLSRNSLLSCSLVSKSWKNLVGDDSLWRVLSEKLRIDRTIDTTPDSREMVSNRIKELKQLANSSYPLLQKRVKTVLDFDFKMLAISKIVSEIDKKGEIQKINDESVQKIELSDQIKSGLNAHLLLGKINLSSLPIAREYATILSRNYGFDDAWISIAHQYVYENNLTEVVKLLNAQLANHRKRDAVIFNVVHKMCRAKELPEAITFYLVNTKPSQDQHLNADQDSSVNTILHTALTDKNFEIYEQVIDQLVPKNRQFSNINNLCKALIEDKKKLKAAELIQKYQDILTGEKNPYAPHELIRLYVGTDQIRKAEEVAYRVSNQAVKPDKLALFVLRNALSDCGYQSLSNLVSGLIEQKKIEKKENQ